MSDALQELGQHLETKRHDCVLSWSVAHGELTMKIAAANIVGFVEFLKNDPACRFSTLVDITAVDYPQRAKRFEVVYHFLSMYQNQRIRLKVDIREEDMVASILPVHPSANWFEREIFDMFGILFSGHPDLRRLLTDYGFRGHPLRKDFPTTGYTEVRYDEKQKRVVYEPVNLVQEYRQFDFMSPWEGAEYILPGDDKAAPDGHVSKGAAK
ncbi:NADH-quinone oxidoreductase subunit C [Loktanella sp. SALINAS62]|uniref:NADH-quinone oxidoreductase subunit C n=1 Tax=Loktanella sp. SALINAS62 TaxID=2706124 RepID=UPI001B8B3B77|nr:NADH-quinone oxidoreductase subunit C [Loktanella sp. SALINAS62]MBS1304213.1 NADH-quinone oxidoreductase subunit C [Loktanella sp. SALINAS62]